MDTIKKTKEYVERMKDKIIAAPLNKIYPLNTICPVTVDTVLFNQNVPTK